jgi:hypothetical protein
LWSDARALLRPQFHRERVSDLHVFEEHISTMVDILPKDGQTLDLLNYWLRFTLDASTGYLFGQSVQSLLNPKVTVPYQTDCRPHLPRLLQPSKVFRLNEAEWDRSIDSIILKNSKMP